MKKLCLAGLIMISLSAMSIAQQQNVQADASELYRTAPHSTFNWKTTSHDFGKIEQNKPVSFTYEFTNTGKEPVVISNVQPGCGCTTQNYTKEPVAPGKKGSVTLTYNAAAIGSFTKSATVTTTGETFILTFNGEVVAK